MGCYQPRAPVHDPPGVTWSDGQPFSAKDVAFTFDLMRRFPALDRAGVWSYLADVKSDAASVEFTFKRAYTVKAR